MTVYYQSVVGGFFQFNWLAAGSARMGIFDPDDSFSELAVTSTTRSNTQGELEWAHDDQYIVNMTYTTDPIFCRVDIDPVSRTPTITEIASPGPTFPTTLETCAWAPESNMIVMAKSTGTAPFLYAYEETATDTFALISPDPFSAQPGHDIHSVCFNPAGTLLVAGEGDSPTLNLYTRDIGTNAFTDVTATNIDTNIPTSGRFAEAVSFSPDGNWFVVAVNSSVADLFVYYYSVSGNNLTYEGMLVNDTAETAQGMSSTALHWLPDSSHLYLVNEDGTPTKTYCWEVDGGNFNVVSLTNQVSSSSRYSAMDPTGTYLVAGNFAAAGGTTWDFHTIDPSTKQLSTATTFSSATASEGGGMGFSKNPPGS